MHPGDLAADFTLPDQFGVKQTLSEALTSGPVVLFFYPAAMTKGCTKESCHFRDLAAEFAALHATRWGISMDAVARQLEFAEAHDLDYPLLSDVNGDVARQYGVKRSIGLLKVRRATFVIGQDLRILDRIAHEIDMNVHADRALRALRER